MPGRTSARYLRMGTASLRQLSTTEKMATILGRPPCFPSAASSSVYRNILIDGIGLNRCAVIR